VEGPEKGGGGRERGTEGGRFSSEERNMQSEKPSRENREKKKLINGMKIYKEKGGKGVGA